MSNTIGSYVKVFAVVVAVMSVGCVNGPANGGNNGGPGSTSNGNFAISSPMYGDQLRMGNGTTVQWISSGNTSSGSYVSLYLYNDSQLVYTISSMTVNDGSQYWTIPGVSSTVGSGSKYRIKIVSYTDTSVYDFSGYFTLLSDYNGGFSFTSPVDSTSWAAGNTYSIVWTSTGLPGTLVRISLYQGSVLSTTIATGVSNSGNYSWTIPAALSSGKDYHISIASYYDAGIVSASDAFTITGTVPDTFEFDGVRDSASALVLGVAQQHNITYNDTDWVKFAADSGTTYIISCTGVAGFRTYLYLFYGSETNYTDNNYSNSSGTLQWIWLCPKTGTFFLRLSSYYFGYVGGYSIKAIKNDPLTSVSFLSPTSTTTWAAGSTYTVSWSPDSSLLGPYVTLYLYRNNTPVYYISSDAADGGSYSFAIPQGLATGSDYRIRISNYSYSTIYGYSPAFTISGISPDTFENDNSRDSAKAIALGATQQHNLTYNDTDWISFSADSGSSYVIQATGASNFRVYAYLFNGSAASSTTYFYSSTNGSLLSLWTCVSSGKYYVRLFPYLSGTGGSYAFRVTRFDPSTAITFSNPIAGTTFSAGSAYTINWNVDTALFSNYVYLYLYKGNQSVLTIASSVSNTGSYLWTVPAGSATGSDYHIRIANYNNSSIYGTGPAFVISGVAPDSYEYDDTAGAAKPATTDGTVQSRTLPRGDIDWISFTAEKDSLYVLRVAGDAGLSMYEYLYSSPTATYLASSSGVSPRIVWACPAGGTYYIRLTATSTSYYGNYAFSIKKFSTMSSVMFVNPTSSSTWAGGTAYSIQWNADTSLFGTTVRLQLASDTATVLSIVTSVSNTGSGTGTYTFSVPSYLASGSTYRIKLSNYSFPGVFGYSPAFTISAINPDSFEVDDSASRAHGIVTTGVTESHTMPYGDIDWYSFSATATTLYAIRTGGTIRTGITLYSTDAKTQLITGNSALTDTNAAIAWICPTNGTYYFRVTSALYGAYTAGVTGSDSSSYRLKVTAPAAGDTITAGQVRTIQWSSTVSVGGNADLFLYNSNGTVASTIAAGVANSGSYAWTPAATLAPGSYYVKVSSLYNANIFGNSGVFTVKAP